MSSKVVVLENEPLLMRALVRALSRLRVTILQAEEQGQAIALLKDNPETAVLVTDYFLDAGETSEGLLEWTRSHLPGCRCLLMSGQDARGLQVHETLYDLFIPKPFSVIEFRQIINDQIQVYQSLDAVTELVS